MQGANKNLLKLYFRGTNILNGNPGPKPTAKEVCSMYGQTGLNVERKMILRQQKNEILRGDYSPITGHWNWESVVKFDCEDCL